MSTIPRVLYYFVFLITFLTVIVVLSGCVDLAGNQRAVIKKQGTRSASKIKATKQSRKAFSYQGEIYTMRGGLGIFSTGMNQLRVTSKERFHVPSSSIMWYHAGKVAKSIIEHAHSHPHQPVILIGHSLGANEQIKVARRLEKEGINVDLLVTVDAVSQTIVPKNVKQVLNVYKPGYVPMFSGLKLKAVSPAVTHIENVNVNKLKGVSVNHFTLDRNNLVQEMILDKIEKVLIHAKSKDA